MAKSSPEKLAQALRANLKRRKAPIAQSGPKNDLTAERAPENSPAQPPAQPPKTSA